MLLRGGKDPNGSFSGQEGALGQSCDLKPRGHSRIVPIDDTSFDAVDDR